MMVQMAAYYYGEIVDYNYHSNMPKLMSYEQLVDEVRSKINVHAKDYVARMYMALRSEGYDSGQARDRIERDWLNVWSKDTIDGYLPQEAKRKYKERQFGSDPNIAHKKPIEVTTIGVPAPVTYDTNYRPLPTMHTKKEDNRYVVTRHEHNIEIGYNTLHLAVRVTQDTSTNPNIIDIDSIDIIRDDI